MTVGPDRALWFTDGQFIDRITTSGLLTTYHDSAADDLYGITTGPDGALWFTDLNGDSIGRITTAGAITTYTSPSVHGPALITPGPDGALWFTDFSGDTIGRITTSGVITTYTDPSIDQPFGIVNGNDGALWFTNFVGSSNSIGRITTTGTISNFSNLTVSDPFAIIGGPDGALWFTNRTNGGLAGSIGRVTTGLTSWPPEILSASARTFTAGDPGSLTISTSASPTAAISESGTLPPGVNFVDNGVGTATLSGTADASSAGTYPITFTASNGVLPNAIQQFSLTVTTPVAPSFLSLDSDTSVAGDPVLFTFVADGTPTPNLSESGALPTGVTFTDYGHGTADLDGTPASGTGGVYPIVVTASNGVRPDASQNFSLTVNEAPTITSANNATFTVGSFGTFTVTATGFPAPTLAENNPLPTGVTFTDNGNGTGTLSGVPEGTGGQALIDFVATNGVNGANQDFTLTVDQSPSITSASRVTFSHLREEGFKIRTTGYPTPAISETGALPPGLIFKDEQDGIAQIKGRAAFAKGKYVVTITASNGVLPPATQVLTIKVT